MRCNRSAFRAPRAHPTRLRPIGGDGLGRAAEAGLSAASAASRHLRAGCCPMRSSKASSMRARPIPASSLVHGPWTRPSTLVSAAPKRGRERGPFPARLDARRWHRRGQGPPVAGILLDNWLKGRRRAVSISKSDKLIEDAQRDWSALGQERAAGHAAGALRPGHAIRLAEGILFTTYATCARPSGRRRRRACSRSSIGWAAISMA